MTKIPNILTQIIAHKQQEIEERQMALSISALQERCQDVAKPRGFIQAITTKIAQDKVAVIAEIKKASPSKGVIRTDFDPITIAQSYAQHGATCLSVLTDQNFFQGHDNYLIQAHDACDLPILRKDFIIDPYQIYEARKIGADCILLIAAVLTDQQLQQFTTIAQNLELDVLVEVHNKTELRRALKLDLAIIGINNRDLRTFKTSLDTTLSLLELIPPQVTVVSESGILQPQDVKHLRDHGVNAFLVGEAMMRADDPGQELEKLFY